MFILEANGFILHRRYLQRRSLDIGLRGAVRMTIENSGGIEKTSK
jgi:hypothetical protein